LVYSAEEIAVAIESIDPFIREHYEVHEWKHASAVLISDFPDQWRDIVAVLRSFRLTTSDFTSGGGGLSSVSQRINAAFSGYGWIEKSFRTHIVVDDREMVSPTHKVDCVKGPVALELEWNNKDPFFDRDLNNFRLLFDLRAISVGIILTKSDELRSTIENLHVWSKYGMSTTWMSKLLPRIEGGAGGGCPILVFGITSAVLDRSAS
jgi:hypothetical protein